MGSGCVSPRRRRYSAVHPAATPSAVSCVTCSLLMSVSDASGDHTTETHSSMDPAMALHVTRIVSPWFPHAVEVSSLSIGFVQRTFADLISMCLLHVRPGSRVSPSIFGPMFTGSAMLSTCSSSCVPHSAGSGVKREHAVPSESTNAFHAGMTGCPLLLCLCVLMPW